MRENERVLSKNKKMDRLKKFRSLLVQIDGISMSSELSTETAPESNKQAEKLEKTQLAVKNLKRKVKRRENKIEHMSEELQSTKEELTVATRSLSSVKALEEEVESLGHQKVR